MWATLGWYGVIKPGTAHAQANTSPDPLLTTPTPAAAAERPPILPGDNAKKVVIEFASDQPMMLWHRPMGSGIASWTSLCLSPCVSIQDQKTTFQARGGPGIPSTNDFELPTQTNHFAVEVKAGNSFKHKLGIGLAITGAPLSAVGLVLIVYGGTLGQGGTRGAPAPPPASGGFLIGGGILLGIGIPLMIAGAVVAVANTTRLQIKQLTPTLWPGRRLASRIQLTPQGLFF